MKVMYCREYGKEINNNAVDVYSINIRIGLEKVFLSKKCKG